MSRRPPGARHSRRCFALIAGGGTAGHVQPALVPERDGREHLVSPARERHQHRDAIGLVRRLAEDLSVEGDGRVRRQHRAIWRAIGGFDDSERLALSEARDIGTRLFAGVRRFIDVRRYTAMPDSDLGQEKAAAFGCRSQDNGVVTH